MNINPMLLLKMKDGLKEFNIRHPKFRRFLVGTLKQVDVGSVVEVSITDPNGNKVRTNLRVTDEDKEFLSNMMSLLG